MKTGIPIASPARNIDSLIAAVAGMVIIYFFTRFNGIGISPDSVTYISTARNLTAGRGLNTFYGTPLVDFPFFYPSFLALISVITRLDTMQFGAVLNEILFGTLLYVSGCLMNAFLPAPKWMKGIVLSCLVMSPCLLEVYSMIWSETLFLLLVLIFIALQYRYSKFHSVTILMALGAVAAIAGITRYAGVALMGTGGILILFDRNLLNRKKAKHLLLFSAISMSLLLLNLLRNSLIEGSFTGNRQKGITPLSQNVYFFGSVIGEWFPLPPLNHDFILIAGWVPLLVLIATLVWILARGMKKLSVEKIAIVFAAVYSLFMILSSTFSRYEQINSRLLAAIFIPLLWMGTAVLMTLIGKSSGRNRYIWVLIAIAAAAFLQYKQWTADFETYDGVKDAGIPGYTETPWTASPTVVYLEHHPELFSQGRRVYSNSPDAVYFYTSASTLLIPQTAFPKQVQEFYSEKNDCLVWFNETGNDALPALSEILQHKKMRCLQQFSDGAIYQSE